MSDSDPNTKIINDSFQKIADIIQELWKEHGIEVGAELTVFFDENHINPLGFDNYIYNGQTFERID